MVESHALSSDGEICECHGVPKTYCPRENPPSPTQRTLLTGSKEFRPPFEHLNHLDEVLDTDKRILNEATPLSYGGMGAFITMSIHWDQLEASVKAFGYDVLKLITGSSLARDDIQELRRDLCRVDAHISKVSTDTILADDRVFIIRRDQEYNASWKSRGGVGAFMMLARKWDRMAPMVEKFERNVYKMLITKPDRIDDVQDLRRYLALVEAEFLFQQARGMQ